MNVAIVLESLEQTYQKPDIPQRLPIVAALKTLMISFGSIGGLLLGRSTIGENGKQR